jgi:hypothetical protein
VVDSSNVLSDLGPLYHNYRLFGVDNEQYPGIFEANQRCKGPILLAYVQWALAKCRERSTDPVSFAELFCADGYYAMAAVHFGAADAIAIDDNRHGQSTHAVAIMQRLGLADRVRFLDMDVHQIGRLPQVDVVANVGGLYHVEDPEAILRQSYDMTRRYLIVQTVVSLANNEPDYFETPAPGHTWGSRWSRQSFERMLSATGWDVVDQHFNELEGNDRREDRGSCYALIRKA